MPQKTLHDKIWADHLISRRHDGTCLIWIDRHLIHEVTSAQAFDGLRDEGRRVRRPDLTLAVPGHNVPTVTRDLPEDPASVVQLECLERNTREFAVEMIPVTSIRQGIVHVIGPEEAFTLPGATLVCGDSHTSTHGALGALAFGIGPSDVEHVLATQTLIIRPSLNLEVRVDGDLGFGVSAKDMALAITAQLGSAGGIGHVIEYRGSTIEALSIEGCLTVCNMAIEAGARAGIIAPDDITFVFLEGRRRAPKGKAFATVSHLLSAASLGEFQVDLQKQLVASPDHSSYHFEVNAFKKDCYLKGLDEIAPTDAQIGLVDAFASRIPLDKPWLSDSSPRPLGRG